MTAAVVGVNLALWFSIYVFLRQTGQWSARPHVASLDVVALVLAASVTLMHLRICVGMMKSFAAAAASGAGAKLAGLV